MRVKRLRGATEGLGGEHGVFNLRCTLTDMSYCIFIVLLPIHLGYFRHAYSPCMFFFFVFVLV